VSLPLLALSFVLVVGGAIVFTNAVEWLGRRLNLGSAAVGAILAAVGTALPESLIPVIAIVSGGGDAYDVAIGAVIGAPFMLATVAMILVGVSARGFRDRRASGVCVDADVPAIQRDLVAFLALFPIGVLVGAFGVARWAQALAATALFAGYGVYVWLTVRASKGTDGDDDLAPLYFDTSRDDPPSVAQIALQFVVALVLLVVGAELFVEQVEALATAIGVATLVVALILAPLATELPEKINSVLWMRRNEDSLALGNISGAMVFQATVPMGLIMLLIDWRLNRFALAAAGVAVVGTLVALLALRGRRFGAGAVAAWAGLFGGFVAYVALA
jgi:cation:H+ antiporter